MALCRWLLLSCIIAAASALTIGTAPRLVVRSAAPQMADPVPSQWKREGGEKAWKRDPKAFTESAPKKARAPSRSSGSSGGKGGSGNATPVIAAAAVVAAAAFYFTQMG